VAARLAGVDVVVDAVMAPPEVDVALLEPYPVDIVVRRPGGGAAPVPSPTERGMLVRALRMAYYALEESPHG
jgi:hypothetical protein